MGAKIAARLLLWAAKWEGGPYSGPAKSLILRGGRAAKRKPQQNAPCSSTHDIRR